MENKNNNKSRIPGYISILIFGLLVCFFGVWVSILSDGSDYERLIAILIVLIAFALLSIIIGFWKPEKTFLYMPWLCLPSVILLIFYMYKEFSILYLVYLILILTTSYTGLKTGRSFHKNKK